MNIKEICLSLFMIATFVSCDEIALETAVENLNSNSGQSVINHGQYIKLVTLGYNTAVGLDIDGNPSCVGISDLCSLVNDKTNIEDVVYLSNQKLGILYKDKSFVCYTNASDKDTSTKPQDTCSLTGVTKVLADSNSTNSGYAALMENGSITCAGILPCPAGTNFTDITSFTKNGSNFLIATSTNNDLNLLGGDAGNSDHPVTFYSNVKDYYFDSYDAVVVHNDGTVSCYASLWGSNCNTADPALNTGVAAAIPHEDGINLVKTNGDIVYADWFDLSSVTTVASGVFANPSNLTDLRYHTDSSRYYYSNGSLAGKVNITNGALSAIVAGEESFELLDNSHRNILYFDGIVPIGFTKTSASTNDPPPYLANKLANRTLLSGKVDGFGGFTVLTPDNTIIYFNSSSDIWYEQDLTR